MTLLQPQRFLRFCGYQNRYLLYPLTPVVINECRRAGKYIQHEDLKRFAQGSRQRLNATFSQTVFAFSAVPSMRTCVCSLLREAQRNMFGIANTQHP